MRRSSQVTLPRPTDSDSNHHSPALPSCFQKQEEGEALASLGGGAGLKKRMAGWNPNWSPDPVERREPSDRSIERAKREEEAYHRVADLIETEAVEEAVGVC
jgi:hypothetical protein